MTFNLSKFIVPAICLVLGIVVLDLSTILTGLSFKEAFSDKESLIVSMAFAFLFWAAMKIELRIPEIPKWIIRCGEASLLAIWAYFSYQYLVNLNFPPADVFGDMAWGFNWLSTHKLFIVLVVAIIGFKRIVGRVSYSAFNNGKHQVQTSQEVENKQ